MDNEITEKQHDYRQSLIEALTGTLDSLELRYASSPYRAAALADRVIAEGWTAPKPPAVKEEWRVIPGYKYFELSNQGFVRHILTKEQVEITVVFGETVYVELHDDNGNDQQVPLDFLMSATWPAAQTEILFDNGNLAVIPDDVSTGKSTLVEIREEEWRDIPGFSGYLINRDGDICLADSVADPDKAYIQPIGFCTDDNKRYALLDDNNQGRERPVKFFLDLAFPEVKEEWRIIDCIPGLNNFEVERGGTIRHKKTGRVQETSYDEVNDSYGVRLILNGKPICLIGNVLADVMWEK